MQHLFSFCNVMYLCLYDGYSLSYQHAEVARISSSRESKLTVAKLDNQQRWFSIGVMEFFRNHMLRQGI
jgi:hypothetical protein